MDTSQYVFPNPIFAGKNIGKELDRAHLLIAGFGSGYWWSTSQLINNYYY